MSVAALRSLHRSLRGLALLVAGALAASGALHGEPSRQAGGANAGDAGIDPFYLDLERSAEAARARGDLRGAVLRLRRACFGMLDQPTRWGACWVRLGLAQAAAGESDGFQQTFERLVAADARFAVWAAAPLAAEERARFEELVVERVATELVRAAPAFAALARRHDEERVRALPPKERRRELERLAAASEDPRWRILLAEEELDHGRPQAALERLAELSAASLGSRVGCLRGEALAGLGRCAPALEAFAGCHPAVEARFAAPALSCLTDLERGAEAARLAAALPAEVRADPVVRRRLVALEARSGGGPGG